MGEYVDSPNGVLFRRHLFGVPKKRPGRENRWCTTGSCLWGSVFIGESIGKIMECCQVNARLIRYQLMNKSACEDMIVPITYVSFHGGKS